MDFENLDPALKATEKQKKNPSLNAIKNISKTSTFSFQRVSYEEIVKETENLKTSHISLKSPFFFLYS